MTEVRITVPADHELDPRELTLRIHEAAAVTFGTTGDLVALIDTHTGDDVLTFTFVQARVLGLVA